MILSSLGRWPRRVVSVGATVVALWACGVGSSLAQSVPPEAADSACDVVTTERVVAVGDVHGAFDQFVSILREAKLIDGRRRWIGGRAILVQLGDVPDRGPDSRKVLDLLRRMEEDAAKAGGHVYALLGNHEAMRMMGDYRYVSEGEYAAFRSRDSEDLRSRYYDLAMAAAEKRTEASGAEFDEGAYRKQFFDATPLGLVEMQMAFRAESDYGRWLRTHDTMVKINGVVFVHGGLTLDVASLGCEAVNARVLMELETASLGDPEVEQTLVVSPEGPLWYRGLVDGAPGVGLAEVEAILTAAGARAVVVGHTAADDFRIRSQFGGRVVQVDTGMLGGEFYPAGVASALEIADGVWTAIYEGRREILRPSVTLGPSEAGSGG